MKCSVCGNTATIQFTDVVNGVPNSRNYCSPCMKKAGPINMSFSLDDVFKSFDNVTKSFDEIFKEMKFENFEKTPAAAEITCSDCGMTYSRFRATGRFGCAKDYDLFKVAPVLEKIHGASVHMGKTPEKSGPEKLERLKKDMEVAVKSENYEKAALIRDEIKRETSK